MSPRTGVVGLVGVLVVAGAVGAKPPDLPAEPLVEGREPTPVAREFHEPDAPRPGFVALPELLPRTGPVKGTGTPLVGFVAEVHDAVLNWLTVPLGPAPVRE